MLRNLLPIVMIMSVFSLSATIMPEQIKDVDAAKEYCSEQPLEPMEGVWLYPDDNVVVMIMRETAGQTSHSFPVYNLWVVESSDTRIRPGDKLGTLTATAQENTFNIDLATESKNGLLLKPKSCLASLSKEGDSLLIKKQKSGIKGRFNLNFNRLLPGFWKIVSSGITTGNGTSVQTPVGMVKIYPSYDGNGSSRRKVRYL